jgi:hypothetical protein
MKSKVQIKTQKLSTDQGSRIKSRVQISSQMGEIKGTDHQMMLICALWFAYSGQTQIWTTEQGFGGNVDYRSVN